MHRFEYTRFVDMDDRGLEALGRFRHEVFIRRLGWELISKHPDEGLEFDEFDGVGTLYVIARNADAAIVGCARLLPTTRSFLLGEVFANLCRYPVPRNTSTWEISRYGATSTDNPHLGMDLFRAAIRLARVQGASAVVAVTSSALERYFTQHGVDFSRLGVPVQQGRQRLVALQFPAHQFSAPLQPLSAPVMAERATSHRLPALADG